MMQQAVCHQDQSMSGQQMVGQQMVGQQMVLCPVRFVYETQILMQPGDQIHPNQTILINPQNTPPWIQNRQVSNPVLYVQQVPNSMVPSGHQHMDHNQLYMQQIANYQMPQMIQNHEQARPNIQMMQMTNIGANVQMERNIGQTITNYGQANNPMPNQMLVPQRQVVNQNAVYAQSELQRQLYRNVRPVANPTRPMSVNPTQNVNPPQNNVNIPVQHFGQTFAPAVGPRPQLHSNIKTEASDKAEVGAANVIPTPRNVQNYPYKPIQPRPQFRPVYSNSVTQTSVQMTSQNNPPAIANRIPNQVAKINYFTSNIDNNTANRKRKSESPDDVQRKIPMNSVKPAEPLKYGSMIVKNITKSMDIGVNTTPVHRAQVNSKPANITLPVKPQVSKMELAVKNVLVNDIKTVIPINTDPQSNITLIEALKATNVPLVGTVEDKLVRKTVFTQAKGRVLNDKEFRPNTIENMQQNLDDFNKMQRITSEVDNANVASDNSQQFNDFIKPEVPKEPEKNKTDTTQLKTEENNPPPDVPVRNDVKVNEVELKHENEFVLTHVLDGFVIQESNVAFPIRKPLKDKTLQSNTQDDNHSAEANGKSVVKEELNVARADEFPVLPFHCLQLNTESKEDNVAIRENIDNPFATIQHSTVKNWTIGQMSSHLVKYGWSETVSLLQDQEIDGESLLLVTKSQLLNIGIKESHADIICEFVKS